MQNEFCPPGLKPTGFAVFMSELPFDFAQGKKLRPPKETAMPIAMRAVANPPRA
jgi:hypothetical protein